MTLEDENERLVIVIDDDEAICRAVRRMLGAQGYEVRTYTSARAYLARQDLQLPACVLVDIRMPDVDGLSLIRAQRAAGSDVAVVVMTAVADIPTVVEAMREGVVDFLAKPFTAADLNVAVSRARETARRAQAGRRAIVELWRIFEPLTPREAEVCALVACGLLNKRIGAAIGTTEKTVKVHRGRVMQKLRLASVADLVRLVDELRATADRSVITLDGAEIERPTAAKVVIDMVAKERERIRPMAIDSHMDQRAIPPLR